MSVPLDRPYYGAPWGVAIVRFFGNYATFRGRASRSEYWWWAFTNAIVAIVINVVGQSLGASEWQNVPVGLPVVVGPVGPVTSAPGVIALVYALAPASLGIAPKLALVAAGTFLGTWLCYEVIRRIPPLRPLFGLRLARAPEP